MAVSLYREVGKGKHRRYQKVSAVGAAPADLTGPYLRKQAHFEALDANVPVIQNHDEIGRKKITDAMYQWFAEL